MSSFSSSWVAKELAKPSKRRVFGACLLGCCAWLLAACGDGESQSTLRGEPTDEPATANGVAFPSDNPEGGPTPPSAYWAWAPSRGGDELVMAIDGGGGSTAERAIEEADIVKLDGNRLYSLSRYGGLSIVELSQRSQLTLLGQVRVDAIPFELYLRGATSLALYQGYGQYVTDEVTGAWSWQTTSQVIAFDVTVPSAPRIIGRFTVPGEISDSRIVGDVLYVVGYEAGYCWQCSTGPRTTIISLSVADPAHVAKVDELAFSESTNNAFSWQRSVAVTKERMYVAGPTWGTSGPIGSTIDIVDISDPTGKLTRGASVQVAGSIQNRWQMDEFEGVLRVISQPGSWSLTEPPRLQTFQVASSNTVTALASLDVRLPERESLRSVRFDGPRGYAITAVRTDPLFTFDLSNPAEPKQLGELVMPGWVYHLEPRGNQLLGLGYDQGNSEGALAVSLFDVSRLEQPSMLSRANFGGNWASMPEDQDRIHKAFGVHEAEGLVLVPFDGYDYSGTCGSGHYRSGVQLINWSGNTLSASGLAPTGSGARRGILLDDDLLTVSEQKLGRFDITDRAQPSPIAELALSQNVTRVFQTGNRVLRVVGDDWQGDVELDVVSVSNADSPMTAGRLRLGFGSTECNGYRYLTDIALGKTRAYVAYAHTSYENVAGVQPPIQSRLMTLDVTNEGAPVVLADALVSESWNGWNYTRSAHVNDLSSSLTLVGEDLLVARLAVSTGTASSNTALEELVAIDLSQPSAPTTQLLYRAPLPSPAGIFIGYGVRTGSSLHGVSVSGSVLAFGTYEPLSDPSGKVQFRLHRIDLSDRADPKPLPTFGIPGALLAYNDESGRLVTLDYRLVTDEAESYVDCHGRYEYANWVPAGGTVSELSLGHCDTVQQTLTLSELDGVDVTVLGSHELAVGQQVGAVSVGNNRVFLTLGQSSSGVVTSCADCAAPVHDQIRLIALRGLSSGELAVGALSVDAHDYSGRSLMAAESERIVIAAGYAGELIVVDTSDVRVPRVVGRQDYVGAIRDLVLSSGAAVAALGNDGVAVLPIGE